MTGHWLLLLIGKVALCALGAALILIFSFAVGLFNYQPPADDPWKEKR